MYGPSRFIWFSIGSIATLAWMHHQHKEHPHCSRIGYGQRAQWERNANPPHGSAGSYNQQQQQQNNNTSWGGQGVANGQPHDGSMVEALQPHRPVDPVDQERERLRQLGRNAEETISGMSEVTVDTMMNALQRLKDRLVERRTQQQSLPGSQPSSPPLPPSASPPVEELPSRWV